MSWYKALHTAQVAVTVDPASWQQYHQQVEAAFQKVVDRSMQRDAPGNQFTMEDAQEMIQSVEAKTQANMQKIIEIVQSAISRVNWPGLPVVIKLGLPPGDYFGPDYWKPVQDGYIHVGTVRDPGFTLFVMDDQLEVDDIAELEDDEFSDARIKQAYFLLVRAIKNPGQLQSNRVLTLYTARPMRDRALYTDATAVPAGIFMTNDYREAQVIGLDIPGPDKIRDVWKVRIEEQYVMEVLNAGYRRHYQVIGDGTVPVKSITLYDRGE